MIKRFFASLLLTTGVAHADAPTVATDIAPVHSLVARVMQGVGTPEMVMKQGASPHGYSMRPSEAKALQDSDLVVWIGHELTPWLERGIETLAQDATTLELLEVPGSTIFNFRESAIFGGEEDHDDHGHGHDDHDDHGHDDHDDHAHDDHDDHAHDDHDDHAHDDHDDHAHDDHDDHAHDDHDDHAHDDHDDHAHDDHDDHAHDDHDDHAHDDHDDHKDEDHDDHGHDDHDDHAGHDDHHHDHDGADPHAWLSIDNAIVWTAAIAEALSEIDPENAAIYQSNAIEAGAELSALKSEIVSQLAPYGEKRFIVFHDAYQYFEAQTGLKATGALQLSDASKPSAARLAAIQEEIKEHGVNCVFAEPQFNDSLVSSVTNGEIASGILDPLGLGLTAGPTLYAELIQTLADNAENCLK